MVQSRALSYIPHYIWSIHYAPSQCYHIINVVECAECVLVCFLGKVWMHEHLSGYFPYIEPNLQRVLNNSLAWHCFL